MTREELAEIGVQAIYALSYPQRDPATRHIGDLEHVHASAVIDVVEPLIRSAEQERLDAIWSLASIHLRREARADLRNQVIALREVAANAAVDPGLGPEYQGQVQAYDAVLGLMTVEWEAQ